MGNKEQKYRNVGSLQSYMQAYMYTGAWKRCEPIEVKDMMTRIRSVKLTVMLYHYKSM